MGESQWNPAVRRLGQCIAGVLEEVPWFVWGVEGSELILHGNGEEGLVYDGLAELAEMREAAVAGAWFVGESQVGGSINWEPAQVEWLVL